MFFNSVDEILPIATRCGGAIFVLPDDVPFKIKNAFVIQPEEKTKITIEQIRQIIGRLGIKQLTDSYIIIRPADLMNTEAANALLKNLEEPKEKVHFVLITNSPAQLLPTILSRAPIYFLRQEVKFDQISCKDDDVKRLAKRLMVAKDSDLVQIAEEISKKKNGVRNYALEILGTAIEMLYKTYFLTNREVFVAKLPKFLNAYDNILKNGHIKLHFVADLC